jgi:hypothetical protein
VTDHVTITGLTKAEAEACLDYLHNTGYADCHACLEEGCWTVMARRQPAPDGLGVGLAAVGSWFWRILLGGKPRQPAVPDMPAVLVGKIKVP